MIFDLVNKIPSAYGIKKKLSAEKLLVLNKILSLDVGGKSLKITTSGKYTNNDVRHLREIKRIYALIMRLRIEMKWKNKIRIILRTYKKKFEIYVKVVEKLE